MSSKSDFLIAGAGVVGLALAWEIKKGFPDASVVVLDKESQLGLHASGRNSGVLHAGLYYSPGSLKARLCVEGAHILRHFCEEEELPFRALGKVILPLREEDDSQIDFLLKRGEANGVSLKLLDEAEISEMEPDVKSLTGRALFSPRTAIFDPVAVLNRLRDKAVQSGVEIRLGAQGLWADDEKRILRTSVGDYSYGLLINAAGAYADRLAHSCDVGGEYVLMPFKGMYFKLKKSLPFQIRRLIYPVPDLKVPFLGVHFTPNFEGQLSIGPSALPAFGPENYAWFSGIDWSRFVPSVYRLGRQYLANEAGFRVFAHQEIRRLFKSELVQAARAMVPKLSSEHFEGFSKVGIRAQLYNTESNQLEMDFVVKTGLNSVHILNAVSPGFTSSISFARFVVQDFICEERERINGSKG